MTDTLTSDTPGGTVYAIGDIQGCHDSLKELLTVIAPAKADQIWFAGDLVNRGPDSLSTLRSIIQLGSQARCVLGNHDLHLLAAAAGVRAPSRKDTLSAVLHAADKNALIHWLRHQPLLHRQDQSILVHAGIHPTWSVELAGELAREVETVLQGKDWGDFLASMYGNIPKQWDQRLSGDDRLRTIVNILTRMRYLTTDGELDFAFKGGPAECPANLLPWFDAPDRQTAGHTIIFGHWSALGLIQRPELIGLDTGCVWGGSLSAVNLLTRSVLQVQCPQAQDPALD
ncbi:MAG: symmetrical bis(5'-nucleosyl)-tetraphosphatase [Burkholderiaceae bacterium]